jgi:hypothetical protein
MTALSLRATGLCRLAVPALLAALLGTWLALSLTAPTRTTPLLMPQELAEWRAVGPHLHQPPGASSSVGEHDGTSTRDPQDRLAIDSMELDRAPVRGALALGAVAVSGVAFAFALALGIRRRRRGER